MSNAAAHAEALAAELRRRLGELRRSEAATGRPLTTSLESAVRELVESEAAVLPAERRAELAELILRDAIGLGPLEELLADPEVEDVLVNGPDRVYVERRGRVERAEVGFGSEQELRDAIERILAPLGRRVDELSPMADARLG
ncbi:MAG: CpaF family protein, partial [bacterium]